MRNNCLVCQKDIKNEDKSSNWKKRGLCKDCLRKYYRDYYHKTKNNPGVRERIRKSNRKKILTVYDGSKSYAVYGLNKRDYPENFKCELCNEIFIPSPKKKGRLFYHHWDDSNLSLGIWICFKCHGLAEAVDLGHIFEKIQKYLKFKESYGYKYMEEKLNG